MLRSNIKDQQKSDFNFIKDTKHINEVWKVIEKNIPVYFEELIAGDKKFDKLKESETIKIKMPVPDKRKRIAEFFEIGLTKYQKEEKHYKKFFSKESMNEFEDENDTKAFKSALSSKIPVIQKARNSKRETMHEWQEKFAHSKPVDIYSIFFNLIDFMDDYVKNTDINIFAKINDIKELENLFVLNEDDDYNVPGVIGMGIKSTVLYHLNSKYFLGANKNTLYGYYFLSEENHFNLPSRTSEFIMINDTKAAISRKYNTNLLIDQNYWYPYDIFILFSLRTYRKLKELCNNYKYTLSDNNRFVHVLTFMSGIWDMKYETILTMTGGDQEDAR